ncbi:MAG: response regulator [Myxococcales bacterium]|nr:response regulator [Myxococcales bacterium]
MSESTVGCMSKNSPYDAPTILEQRLVYLADARVLVIDDEPAIIDAIEAILEATVDRAGTVADGIEQCTSNGPFDLVIVDKNLPDGSGLDTIRGLRAQWPDQEFILITGYPSMDSAIEAVEAGAFDYLPKPFQLGTLLFKARNAVAKTRQNRHERSLVAQLKASEERHRALFEASSDAILMFDAASGDVTAANSAAARLFGYAACDLTGLSRVALLHEPTRELIVEAESPQARVLSAMRRDGSEFPVEVSRGKTEIEGQSAFVEVLRDMSDRIRMQEERESTAKRLRASEKMQALGQLAAGIAHDFNNLLVVFMGASGEITDWISDHPEHANDDLRHASNELWQATKSSRSLTRQLLGFGRRQVQSRQMLDMRREIDQVAHLLSRTLTERIQVEIDVPKNLPPLLMDRGQLEQVLTNLALNARDAMPEGGRLLISAKTTPQESGQASITLRITDTGTGMDEATAERIFDPFFTTKGPDQGTGIGLATVYSIVRSNGGEIHVESSVGVGTTFEITFPCSEFEEEEEEEEEEDFPETTSMPYQDRVGAHILVVEDHEQVRTFVERALRRAGYTVSCAPDSEAALALVESEPCFDMLLTDEGLPKMQGHELANRLSNSHKIKVLCMSAYAAPSRPAGGPSLPFLAKPFSSHRLLARVREALNEFAGDTH